MRRTPPIDDGDTALWDDVRRTIRPLPGRRVMPPRQAREMTTHLQSKTNLARPAHPVLQHLHRDPPPLGHFDRRQSQRLSRGQLEPERKLDLHGTGLEEARMRLYHFIEQQRRAGVRLVLVITGKGASPFGRHTLHGRDTFHSPEREGRLRREVPQWLSEHVFRAHVVAYQPAHPRHGGGGAYYVGLRQMHGTL